MFGRKKKKTMLELPVFDSSVSRPVLRCSICNGEQVFGLKDLKTGKFTEICLVRNDHDLDEIKRQYGITEITREY